MRHSFFSSGPGVATSCLLVALLACGPAAPTTTQGTTLDPTQASTTAGSGSTTSTTDPVGVTVAVTSGTSSSTTLESTSSESAPTTGDPSCNFLCLDLSCAVGLGARCSPQCDVFLQDCNDGEKCSAVITDGGGSWNSSSCVPVTGDGVAGDACTAESVADGLDSCAKGNMCWGVDMDGNGTCVALCMGTAEAGICPDMGVCTIANNGSLNLCLPSCDPLLQDCAEGDACYPIGDDFTCAPDASGAVGKTNDPCEFINVCEAGLLCGDPAFVGAGCPQDSAGCCTPFCEFPDGACPNPDQQCVQWFDPMMLPEGDPLLDIGACGIPT